MDGCITTTELVASVSNRVSLGNKGASYMSAEQLKVNIERVKQLTDKPIGVNLFIPESPEVSEKEINKANEWLRPFREELNLPEVSEVKKSNALIFEAQINVII